MPVQPPNYEVPQFNPGGSTDLGAAMQEWTQQFGQQYREGQESLQRLPFIVTTNWTSNSPSGSTNMNSPLLNMKVTMQGGEQVVAMGNCDFQVSAGGVMTTGGQSISNVANAKLRVTYPGGTETTFGPNQEATLRITLQGNGTSQGAAQRTTVISRANVSFTWPIEARFQTGGEHTFQLRTTGTGGKVTAGQLTVLVV